MKCFHLLCCLATSTPRATGSSATESELERSTGRAEPAAGTNTSKWEDNGAVQSVWVSLTLRVQDYLRMRHNFSPSCQSSTFRRLGVFRGSYLLPHGADQLLILLPAVAPFSLELELQRLQLAGHGSLHLHCLHKTCQGFNR